MSKDKPPSPALPLQQHHPNATSHRLVGHVLAVDAALDRRRPPVVQVVMQLAVAGAELLTVEEQGVVVECQGVEDVEFCLFFCGAKTLVVSLCISREQILDQSKL